MSFHLPLMLAGLAAVAIPPIIHLLNRRRYEVVDWGAMQFLQVSEVTRRRLLIEELLLMALRMGLIAVLVLALAGPFSDDFALAGGQRPSRDVVLVFDGSASMSFRGAGKSAHEQAREWADRFLKSLRPGDGVAVVVARKQPLPLVETLRTDLQHVREKVGQLPEPAGSCDWPRAVRAAYDILDRSQRAERDVILIGDGQRFGWADDRALGGWESARDRHTGAEIKPKLWVVNLDPKRPAKPANWALAPLTASRAVVAEKQEVTFRTALLLGGQAKYEPPYELRLEVDGAFVARLEAPQAADLDSGQVPLSFTHRFTRPGSHLVSVTVVPDPPPERRPPGYVVKDHLPVDNRRDFAVEVVEALPVLLVDGDDRADPPARGSDFLRDALAPKRDQAPAVRTRVVPVRAFTAALLQEEIRDSSRPEGPPAGDPMAAARKLSDARPRVLILCNVPRLTSDQQRAVRQFLEAGGGVLVTLGERVDPKHYNRRLFSEGKGWLPARLDRIQGDENDVRGAARPVASSFHHPALELFRKAMIGGLDSAWFSRWWQVIVPEREAAGAVVARLNKADAPLLVEKRHGEGRVVLCAVPLDSSWRTNVTELPAFVPLAHELVYYLAAARAADHNLDPGQPLRYRLPRDASLDGLRLLSPAERQQEAEEKKRQEEEERPQREWGRPLVLDAEDESAGYPARVLEQAQGRLVVHEGMNETGVWELRTRDGQTTYYVVQHDPREADLTPVAREDRKKLDELLPFHYEDDAEALVAGLSREDRRQEFWWWFLLGLIALLCAEVWFTRKIVKGRC